MSFVPISEINHLLECSLCHGYLIDATTIIDCMHSFCRSCILIHFQLQHVRRSISDKSSPFSIVESLQTSTTFWCPECHIPLHTARPELFLRPDHWLQSLVYKTVPDLYESEMRRRRIFYASHPCSDSEQSHLSLEQRGLVFMSSNTHRTTTNSSNTAPEEEEDFVSLNLHYFTYEDIVPTEASLLPGLESASHFPRLCHQPRLSLHYLLPISTPLSTLEYILQHKFCLFQSGYAPVFFIPHTDTLLPTQIQLQEVMRISHYKYEGPLELYFALIHESDLREAPHQERTFTDVAREDDNDSGATFSAKLDDRVHYHSTLFVAHDDRSRRGKHSSKRKSKKKRRTESGRHSSL